ncbi:hypothetical protein KFK09_002431 [Dendrobium nobile]|uniref:CCHC-type domain-containing protein n=1 Tax=Dendrobium nobile TaxID=94219 RepID=A0A8T3C3U3_DENNO|nr:hypothetical protein KFK09_002431 [Dendrobium nobile]
MERNRILSSESWSNYRKGLSIPVKKYTEVFNGGLDKLDEFNKKFKNLTAKPLLINEGGLLKKKSPPVVVSGKGKEIRTEDAGFKLKSFNSPVSVNEVIGKFDLEASSSKGTRISIIKKVNYASLPSSPSRNELTSSPHSKLKSRIDDKVNKVLLQRHDAESTLKEPVIPNDPINHKFAENGSVWHKKQNIKVDSLNLGSFLTEDGKGIKLLTEKELENVKRLEKALVVKIFGDDIPFHMVSLDLRRQWNGFGKFHLTGLGRGWMLCSFEDPAAVENILSGGPWWVRGQVVGLDKWSTSFNPNSLKGISAPVWIRLPNLPLQCWDEVNICRITLMVGKPFLLDGNMFQWSRREFARICVRIHLDIKLPKGIWVEGISGKFFQAVEYESLSKICEECGRIGHVVNNCSEVKIDTVSLNAYASEAFKTGKLMSEAKTVVNTEKAKEDSWIQVKHGNRRFKRMGEKSQFFNRISTPMKKIYIPKNSVANSKTNGMPKGASLKETQQVSETVAVPGTMTEGENGSDLLNKILDIQQSEVNRHVSPLRTINKFYLLANLDGSILNEDMEKIDYACIEEGEIVEQTSQKVSNEEAVFDKKILLSKQMIKNLMLLKRNLLITHLLEIR